jgi:precorrin-4 methylase
VADATMSTQHHWRGTLDDLAADRHVGSIHRNAAATIVVGDVVTFARATQERTTEREALAERRVFQCL